MHISVHLLLNNTIRQKHSEATIQTIPIDFFSNICMGRFYCIPLYHRRMETNEYALSDDVDAHQQNAATYHYKRDIGYSISFLLVRIPTLFCTLRL